ncbi:sigma-E factor negative regulatory protein [Thauera aromatica]|uniref:sigma-E factor negative regulatory protein n=1 Tax=Thauera aromatica TaxID=59405 RepID=UPI000D16E05E|nr:sigma-E factor negative regulatory protein [Thauera aromatica]MCK2094493.1 sigma-E factor negative regulatory protein [Thauera aromatica]
MKDTVSALLDGELEDHAIAPVFEKLRRDPELRKEWDAYCMIGDALRGEHDCLPDFAERVMANLDREPVVFTPAAASVGSARRAAWSSMLPVAASVMGVAAVGLVAATLYSRDDAAVARLAAVPAPAQITKLTAGQGALPRAVGDDPLREYVFAHRGISGGGPVPAGLQYVRSVSEQRQGAGR